MPRLLRLAGRPPLRLGTPHARPAASIQSLGLRAHAAPGEIRKTQGQRPLGSSRTLPGQRAGHRETHPLGSGCHRHPEARPRACSSPSSPTSSMHGPPSKPSSRSRTTRSSATMPSRPGPTRKTTANIPTTKARNTTCSPSKPKSAPPRARCLPVSPSNRTS